MTNDHLECTDSRWSFFANLRRGGVCFVGTIVTAPNGSVNGYLETLNDGLSYFTYELGTGTVNVKLYKSHASIEFSDIDAYEGESYERIFIPVKSGTEWHIANIYERKYSYE